MRAWTMAGGMGDREAIRDGKTVWRTNISKPAGITVYKNL